VAAINFQKTREDSIAAQDHYNSESNQGHDRAKITGTRASGEMTTAVCEQAALF
jgi:hypothetical protein